ncbi:HTH domain-containing protein [Fluviicola sp.]|uniref:HTH domain-containing protein n=1 Tax=Fluviicola sp. TaxID=1917219 RepID=UPI00261F19DD|nr:HTH domain-containing protein [Fluviicola sp.]
MKMTIKEAILKVLDENKRALTYLEVHELINANQYIDWSNAKTPTDTIGAQLGDFIRKGDSRVKRSKMGGRHFLYYSAANEDIIGMDVLTGITESQIVKSVSTSENYKERDLHILLSTFLRQEGINAKTIFHEKSKSNSEKHQKWIHPDMIGASFLKLKTKESQALQRTVNKEQTFRLYSYEIKREIKSDYELKECFFQAVSNSSWAHHGYLVAFEIEPTLREEMKRLNESFGIGIIELSSNPYQTKVHFPSRYSDLDFKTIDKLCKANPDFAKFIDQVEKILITKDRFLQAIEKEFVEMCDGILKDESAINKYCQEKNIPISSEE